MASSMGMQEPACGFGAESFIFSFHGVLGRVWSVA